MLCRVTTEARRVLVSVLVLACGFCLYDAKMWRHMTTTCPQLLRCHCKINEQQQLHATCRNFSHFQELGPDIARLQNVIVKKLFLDNVQISEIPARLFSNHSIFNLVVKNCPLRDIGEAAIAGMGSLARLELDKDQLESVPSGLSAATRLRTLQIRRNPIKFLTGVLQLPELIKLDLAFNEIESIDERFLLESPNLRYLFLSDNHIEHIPNRLFEKTRKLHTVEFRGNRIMTMSSLFDGLRNLRVSYLSSKIPNDTVSELYNLS